MGTGTTLRMDLWKLGLATHSYQRVAQNYFLPPRYFSPGVEIKFPLLFTEDLNFDLEPFLFSADKGLGTMPAENTCVGSTMESL